jgi:hypothetical protein
VNEFGADFLECFKIPNRAAHNGDLWESVFNAANQTKEKYVPTKISGDGGMEVRLHNWEDLILPSVFDGPAARAR